MIIIVIITHLRVFHNIVRWCFQNGVWWSTSFLKSPGLFSVLWPILINFTWFDWVSKVIYSSSKIIINIIILLFASFSPQR